MKKFKRESGSTLVVILLVMAVMMILVASSLFSNESQHKMNLIHSDSTHALELAESGIHHALWLLNKHEWESIEEDTPIVFGQGSYELKVLDGSVAEGMLNIQSSGHASEGQSSRHLEAVLLRRTFTQHVWLSDSEGSNVWTATGHVWDGPFHTNGDLKLRGQPHFKGRVTYGGSIVTHSSGADPIYDMGAPIGGIIHEFPVSNSQLKSRALAGGHYYNGMTTIYLKDDGTYDVRHFNRADNKWYFNNVEYSGEAKATTPSLALPDNGVIYVDGLSESQWDRRNADVYVSGTLKGELTIASANQIYITGYDPTDFRQPIENTSHNPLFIPQGAFTGGLTYKDDTEDLLGLIAQNNIVILRNRWPKIEESANSHNRWDVGEVSVRDIKLYGSFFALNGSVTYDFANSTEKGTAELFGSLVQKTRTAWRRNYEFQEDQGYNRNFKHDPRLETQSPPYFLEPQNTGWYLSSWREVSP